MKESEIVFATNNKHKLDEVRQILGDRIKVLSLSDIGCHEDIPETGTTLEANALQKARYIYDHYHLSCFADDTGLEVEALGGAPGVYTARYAAMEAEEKGEPENPAINGAPALSHDSNANMARLLRELNGKENRRARFRTVIALIEAPASPVIEASASPVIEASASPVIEAPASPVGCVGCGSATTSAVPASPKETLFEGIVNGEIATERSGTEGFGYDPVFRPEGYAETFADLGTDIKNHISHRARATQKLAEYL